MMAQYMAMRKSLPADVILFYRLGDFYEMFFEDAKSAAPILNVALTKRGGTPMCGVPYHAAQAYIARLLKAENELLSQCFRLQRRTLPVAFVDAPAVEQDDLFHTKGGETL